MPFLTVLAPLWYSISTMHGASRSIRLAAWPARWAQCSPSAIVAMSTTKRPGCITLEVVTIAYGSAGLLMLMYYTRIICIRTVKTPPIIGIDKNGFAVVCCFDENGFETTFMTQVMMGGCGGGAGGYVGSVYAKSKLEDVSILVAAAKTNFALFPNLSFEFGVGMGLVGDIDAIIANVGGGVRFDALNLSISRNGIFFGEKAEFSMSFSGGIKGIDNASIGGSMTATRTHSYSGCKADHALFDYLDCPYTESSFDTGMRVNLGVSAYLGIGATINFGLDIDALWNDLLDIWVR